MQLSKDVLPYKTRSPPSGWSTDLQRGETSSKEHCHIRERQINSKQ